MTIMIMTTLSMIVKLATTMIMKHKLSSAKLLCIFLTNIAAELIRICLSGLPNRYLWCWITDSTTS